MNYTYLCYCDADREMLIPLLERMKKHKCRIVHAEKDSCGEQIRNCKAFVVFLTPESIVSQDLTEQLKYACELKKEIYPVIIGDFVLPDSIQYMIVNCNQWIRKDLTEYDDLFFSVCAFMCEHGCISRKIARMLGLAKNKKIANPKKHFKAAAISLFVILAAVVATVVFIGTSIERSDSPLSVNVRDFVWNLHLDRLFKRYDTFTGVLCSGQGFDGCKYYLELEEPVSYYDPYISENEEEQYVTDTIIWFSAGKSTEMDNYVGMTVTVKGVLYNYRHGYTLMLDSDFKIIDASGTPISSTPTDSYENWDSTDDVTKFFDAMVALEDIIYQNEEIWSVVCEPISSLDDIKENGFAGEYNMVSLQINDVWTDGGGYGYDVYVTPYLDKIAVIFVSSWNNEEFKWYYTWSGEMISGNAEPIDEFVVNNGLHNEFVPLQ